MKTKLYASPYGGRRYHGSPSCIGLNSTDTAMCYTQAVPQVTRREIERRRLTPCKVCEPPAMLRLA